MWIFSFWQKETGAKRVSLATIEPMEAICFRFLCTFLMQGVRNTTSIYPEIFFIQYFTFDDVSAFLICIIHKCQYLCNEKRYSKKEHAILLYFKKRLSDKQQLFFMSYTQIFGCYTISKCLACPPFQYISFFQAHIFVISIQSHYSISTHREFIKVR